MNSVLLGSPYMLFRSFPRLQKAAKVQRVARRLIDVFESVWPKMDTTEVSGHDYEDIVYFQYLEEMGQPATCSRFAVVIVVLVEDASDLTPPSINNRMRCSGYSPVRHEMGKDLRNLGWM